MNSLYTSGVRQTTSIQTDLERFRNGDNSASLIGQFLCVHGVKRQTIIDGVSRRADFRVISCYA